MERGIEMTGPIAPETQAAVDALLRQRDLSPRQRERLEMVKAAWLGSDVATIALEWTHTAYRASLAGGVPRGRGDSAGRRADPGRPPKADATFLAALEQAVETPPRTLGLPFDVWTSARLSAYLVAQTGIRLAPGWLRVLLHRHHFACGRAKHTLTHWQDPAEVAACEHALRAAGEKGGGPSRALRTVF